MIQRGGGVLANGPFTWSIILTLVASVALVTADVLLMLEGRAPMARIHTVIVAALIVAAVKLMMEHQHRRTRSELADALRVVINEIHETRCECPPDGPTQVLRAVGTVDARAITSEIPPDNVLSFETGRMVGRAEAVPSSLTRSGARVD